MFYRLKNTTDKTVHTKYYLPTVEIKDYNVMIDGQNFFDKSVKGNLRTYDNIQKITTGRGDDYTTNCLLDNNYFNKLYKRIAIDLSKQLALDTNPRAIEQINFTGNLNRGQIVNDNTTMYFIIEETQKAISGFSQGTVKVL